MATLRIKTSSIFTVQPAKKVMHALERMGYWCLAYMNQIKFRMYLYWLFCSGLIVTQDDCTEHLQSEIYKK